MSVPVCYESVTCFLGFHQEDVGKTMGLSCYGKPNDEIPSFLIDNEWKDTSDVVAGNILLNTVIYPQLRNIMQIMNQVLNKNLILLMQYKKI